MLIYEDKIPTSINREDFVKKVKGVSKKLDIDPNWLMAVMYFESRLNPRAVNPKSGATGLIQFMPKTAEGLGTTTAALKEMPYDQQLLYVYRYYLPYKDKITQFHDLYLATLFPIAIGKSDDYVLRSKTLRADTVASSNPIFDLNKDKAITVGEVKKVKIASIPPQWRNIFDQTYDNIGKFTRRNKFPIALTVLGLGVGGFLLYKYILINKSI